MENVLYVGFYSKKTTAVKRTENIAASRKMEYIANELKIINQNSKIISTSCAECTGYTGRFQYVKEEERTDDGITAVYTPSWRSRNKIIKKLSILYSLVWLFFYLLKQAGKKDTVVVYHMPLLSVPVRLAKRFKHFRLILEVEEVYADIWEKYKKYRRGEQKLIFVADYFIFASELLQKKLDPQKQRSMVIYGEYKLFAAKKESATNEIGLIYAGSIDVIKNGAFIAVECMKYLPTQYKLTVLGHGTERNVEKLKKGIEEINSIKGTDCCRYLGVLHGNELSCKLIENDIGLNPQNTGDYMETAFPSKIMVYLNHGLRVVSTPVASVHSSRVAEAITFASSADPKEMAEAVLYASQNNCNVTKLLSGLRNECVSQLRNMVINE